MSSGDPKDRLWSLMLAILNEDLARYDLPIRAWAARNPDLLKVVKSTDRFRLSVTRGLFLEMGFVDEDAETRARTLVAATSAEGAIFDRIPKKRRLEILKRQHALLTQRW
jgi:hypothetical protein